MTGPENRPSSPLLMDIDRLMHEPAHLMILANLYVMESADFIFMMNRTGLSWGNLSSHLTKLENAGYIEMIKEFVNRRPHSMVRITPAGSTALLNYRSQMQGLPCEWQKIVCSQRSIPDAII